VRTVTATGNLVGTDDVVLCNAASNTTLTLPSAASNSGHEITVKRLNITAFSCTVSGIWTSDGGNLALVAPNANSTTSSIVTVVSDGANWYILNQR
jgi:hypothetical protein